MQGKTESAIIVHMLIKIIGSIIGGISLIIAIIFVVIPWISAKTNPVVVTPKSVSIPKEWLINTSFYVKNRTDNTLSSIWIKVTADDSDLTYADISVDAEDGLGARWEETISNISIDYSYMRMNGTDAEGKSCFFFIIHDLPPKATQAFNMKTTKAETNEHQNPRILLKIVGRGQEPFTIIKKNNEVAYVFTPPETFTIRSISLIMRRN